jgi:hypothetical protein
MKVLELKKWLDVYEDDDEVVINVFDDVFYEDNYDFYVDGIKVDSNHTEVQLCPVKFANYSNKT